MVRTYHGDRGSDCAGNLTNANLMNADLANADLTNANFMQN
ncbi:MAG: pentapeptide repeat-containing protein [Actinomycetota bacterium]